MQKRRRFRKVKQEGTGAFRVGDLVKSSANDRFTYKVVKVKGHRLDVRPVDAGWTDCISTGVEVSLFTKI